MPKVDPRLAYEHATNFRLATEKLCEALRGPPEDDRFGAPWAALVSFTTELYLKCLIAIDKNGDAPSGHNLAALFDLLPDTDQKHVEAEWATFEASSPLMQYKAKVDKTATDVRTCLKESSSAFESYRYLHEQPANRPPVYIGQLLLILHNLVVTRKPEWAGTMRLLSFELEAWPGS